MNKGYVKRKYLTFAAFFFVNNLTVISLGISLPKASLGDPFKDQTETMI